MEPRVDVPQTGELVGRIVADVIARKAPETVVCCEQKSKTKGGYYAKQVRGFGYMVAVVLTCGALLLVLMRFTPGPYAAMVAAGVTLLIWVAVVIRDRVPRAEVRRCRAMLRPLDTPGRVRCIGKARQIARVLSNEAIADRMFEPRVFRGTGSTKSTGRKKAAQIVIGVVVAAAVVWLQWRFMHQIGNAYADIMVSIAAAMVIGGAMFPTYLRVVPGRIDVMECGWLGLRILSVKRIDLKNKPVVVDVHRQTVRIGDAADAPTIAFGGVWGHWEFARAVLEGSVSTHSPAPLPDDALTG